MFKVAMKLGFKASVMSVVLVSVLLGQFGNFQSAGAQSENRFVQLFMSWFNSKPPVPKGSGGSRPLSSSNAVCSLVPHSAAGEMGLLRSRPLWIWRGDVEEVWLLQNGKKIWQQVVTAGPDGDGLTRLQYSGPELVPGGTYRLVMRERSKQDPSMLLNFQMGGDRSRLESLQAEVMESATKAGKKDMELVRERVKFLTQEELWAEIVQVILNQPAAAGEWQDLQTTMVQSICDPQVQY